MQIPFEFIILLVVLLLGIGVGLLAALLIQARKIKGYIKAVHYQISAGLNIQMPAINLQDYVKETSLKPKADQAPSVK